MARNTRHPKPNDRKTTQTMISKKRLTVALTIVSAASALICSSIAGAIEVPSGVNIAAALVIGISLLIEAPLTAMAFAKHKNN